MYRCDCQGDSGGPLMYKPDDAWCLVGATSYGTGETCGMVDKPGIYAKVANYKDWILATTGNGRED